MAFDAKQLEGWLRERLAVAREIDARTIDVRERFSRYGLDSLGGARLIAELSAFLGRPLSPTLVWEAPTIEALAALVTGTAKATPTAAPEPEAHEAGEPIALIGMACRFPGAGDPEAFWRLLRDGRDAIGDVPEARGWEEILTQRGVDRGERAKVRRGGFLDSIDGFDPLFFGISPREATAMDPQQRLMLELAWEALEDARIRPSSIRGSRTAVFAGAIWSDYSTLLFGDGPEAIGQYTVTGYHHAIIANRISYAFGLMGPSVTLDSACSSGLFVVHLACDSLRRGESTLALVGAVNLNVLAESAIGVSRFGALSPDGRCYTFDARANGYVRGEGGGVAILKTLSRAIADGDPIYCVIRGSAINNDGASNGMTAPNPAAQEAVLRTAYRNAGIHSSSVQYVEAHGTGTPLGDPIEARALGAVLGHGRPAEAPLLVGSAKTNIGHLEGAAGTVGVFKAALAIKHRLLPPSLNFESANPHAPLDELHIAVPTELRSWPAPELPLTAGISSFGLGGTNGHVVLEEWPGPRSEVLAFSAETQEALRADVERARANLAAGAGRSELAAFAAAAASRCRPGPSRLAALAATPSGMERALSAHLAGESSPAIHVSATAATEVVDPSRGVVFVFPGQGAQWFGMARSLLQGEPVFRATLEACDRHIQHHLGISLITELTRGRAASRLDRIEVSLPAIISIDIAVSAWWRSIGIEPAAVVGHSTGEIAAAHVAGALDLDDTMRVICAYGRIIARQAGQGGMALVGLPWDETGAAIAGFEGKVFRAIQDSATATVLAGEPSALAALLEKLSAQGIFCRRVSMNVAPHSPMVDSMRGELFALLDGIRPRKGTVPLISEVTGEEIDGASLDAAHWVRNFGDRALFATAIATLVGRGHRAFLDVGPHPLTSHSVEATLRHAGVRGVVLSSLRRDEEERGALLDTVGALHALGFPVRWGELYPGVDEEASVEASAHVLPLSARSPAALSALASAYANLLATDEVPGRLSDFARAASVERDHHPHRLAVVGRTRKQVAERLRAFAQTGAAEGIITGQTPAAGPAKVVFVFPGQGSQWLGMGRQLLVDEPAFREALEACDRAIVLETGFSVLAEIAADEARSRLSEIDVVQPVLFAVEVALAALWRSWGVEPDAVVGHSMGEVAAAQVAGILSLDDAARVICRRSHLLRRVSGKGAMGLVELTLAQAEQALAGYEDRLSVAVSNGPRSTVLSGDPAALEEVLGTLEKRGVFCRRVKVDVASHSPQMDPLSADLLAALAGLRPQVASLTMRSTVTAAAVTGPDLDATYWVKNLRAPVLFSNVTQQLIDDDHLLFVEMSPHPILLPAVDENLREKKRDGASIASVRRNTDERRSMLEALGTLYTRGLDIDWKRIFPAGGRTVSLPTYPWQRERFWVEAEPSAVRGRGAHQSRDGHRLLGTVFRPADRPEAHYWEQWLSATTPAYLAHHRVREQVVFPGAGYVEMALSAGAEVYGAGEYVVEDIRFDRMLLLTADDDHLVQTALTEQANGQATLVISSRSAGENGWTRHAGAKLGRVAPGEPAVTSEAPSRIQQRCPAAVDGPEHYAGMKRRGLDYGSHFQGVERLWVGDGEALARVSLPADRPGDCGGYTVHPALLDACFQLTVTLLPSRSAAETFVPAGVARARSHRHMSDRGWVHVRAVNAGEGALAFDLTVLDEAGDVALEISALRVVQLEAPQPGSADVLDDCAYTVAWRRKELHGSPPRSERRPDDGAWLIVLDTGGLGAALASALRAAGEACFEVSPGGSYGRVDERRFQLDLSRPSELDRLFAEAFGKQRICRGVVHCASLSAHAWQQTNAGTLEADLQSGSFFGVRIAQALLRQGLRDTPRLVVVTRGAQAVGERPGRAAIAQAPLWGLARTIALEHPELECTRIDLPITPSANEADLLVRELVAGDGEDQVALRPEARFVARLVRESLPRVVPPVLEAYGTFLITGGLGGLGLAVAGWMVSHGARHLALVGRSEPSLAAMEAIRGMEDAGAEIRVLRGDVSRAADVEQLMAQITERMPPLKGLVHAAGVLDDRTLLELGEAQFWTPMGPKVFGAWNLHVATRSLPLEFFVMYSSLAALLGSPGQTAYAAANAFLDALAHARIAEGLPAVSVQWGPFAEVGLAALQNNRGQRLAHQGMESFTPQQGTELFSRLLRHPRAEVGLVRISLRQWLESHPQASGMRFLTELESEEVKAPSHGTFRETLERAPPADRAAQVMGEIVEQLGRVVRMDPSRIDSRAQFTSFGVDSLLSLELRNRLEASFGLRLSAALLFIYPTVAALADHLLAALAPAPETPTVAPPPTFTPPQTELADLGGDDLLAMLDEELSLARKFEKTR